MRILLHICCANCAIYPVAQLREQNHLISGFFFNHNIHPYLEFQRRLGAVREYAEKVELPVLYREDYLLEEFLAVTAPLPAMRCDYCYRSRLEMTARAAVENGFEGFSSSLLYSRYQQHEKIHEYGEQVARQHGLQFVYQDFRRGWKEGIEISKGMGLYRQQYCGCIYSEKERYSPRCRN